MKLPLQPPIEPMLANLNRSWPAGSDWNYEPKWDGFRTIVFFDGQEIYLQSRDLKPMGRYFPELEKALREVLPPRVVLDGEMIVITDGGLDFEALQMRIHPAASRINKLAGEIPASFVAFDLLALGDDNLMWVAQGERRALLEKTLRDVGKPVYVTPSTTDRALAEQWFVKFEGAGLDGIIAKRTDQVYRPNVRDFVKIKHQRTCEVVVGGFRWAKDLKGQAVGSLLLGLYDDQGVLHHVGHTSSFKAAEKRDLVKFLEPYLGGESFGGGTMPGSPSRWTGSKDLSWEKLRPELVCEVAYEKFQFGRFRHAATFHRWRHDKPASACTMDQIDVAETFPLAEIF